LAVHLKDLETFEIREVETRARSGSKNVEAYLDQMLRCSRSMVSISQQQGKQLLDWSQFWMAASFMPRALGEWRKR